MFPGNLKILSHAFFDVKNRNLTGSGDIMHREVQLSNLKIRKNVLKRQRTIWKWCPKAYFDVTNGNPSWLWENRASGGTTRKKRNQIALYGKFFSFSFFLQSLAVHHWKNASSKSFYAFLSCATRCLKGSAVCLVPSTHLFCDRPTLLRVSLGRQKGFSNCPFIRVFSGYMSCPLPFRCCFMKSPTLISLSYFILYHS